MDARPKLNGTRVARVGVGMLLGDDDAVSAHFDKMSNFYSKTARSVGYGEVYCISASEFISRAKQNVQTWDYLKKRLYQRFDYEQKHTEITSNMKFSCSANKADTEDHETQKDKVKRDDFFKFVFEGLTIPERKVEMAMNKLRPQTQMRASQDCDVEINQATYKKKLMKQRMSNSLDCVANSIDQKSGSAV